MHNKRHKILKYITPATSADDVTRNHAYSRVAKENPVVPTRRPGAKEDSKIGYRDSMVGSIAQYREAASVKPAHTTKEQHGGASDTQIIGNRAKSGSEPAPNKGNMASLERRHHFIEPPKRGFNRFG